MKAETAILDPGNALRRRNGHGHPPGAASRRNHPPGDRQGLADRLAAAMLPSKKEA